MDKMSIFVALTGIAVLLQAGVLLAIYIAMRKSTQHLEELAGDVKTKVMPTVTQAQEMLADLRILKGKLELETSPEAKADDESLVSKIKRHKRGVLLTLAAVLLVAVAVGYFFVGPAPPVKEKSIAVLPFENLSEEKSNAYFADGIQDEILTRLSKIADLKVISRTSTERYKDTSQKPSEIAKQLGVANLLEGSVQKTNDQVRVNVQLIRAANDSHVWADTFDRKLTDIFSVES